MTKIMKMVIPRTEIAYFLRIFKGSYACFIFLLSVFTSSLLKPDEQTGMRQIEQLKLVVTET